MDLLFRYERLSKLFERIREALSCAICYEFFGKSKAGVTVLEDQPHKSEERGAGAISLLCGHSFCTECWKTWEGKTLLSPSLRLRSLSFYGDSTRFDLINISLSASQRNMSPISKLRPCKAFIMEQTVLNVVRSMFGAVE